MVIAYNPKDPLDALFNGKSKPLWRTVLSPIYWGTLLVFVLMRVALKFLMSEQCAKDLDQVLTYPSAILGTFFAFLIGFFINQCYTRYMDNWHAAMIGWSRLNDLGMQVRMGDASWCVVELVHELCCVARCTHMWMTVRRRVR